MNTSESQSWLGGISIDQFLSDYWQKKALFVKGALTNTEWPLDADELAALACEELAESRLVQYDSLSDNWQVQHGPFTEKSFSKLPEKDWTLLVTDVDKWHYETEQLLRLLDFLPRWRIDDIMISYAVPGGSVGPHIDQYDVFLIQTKGKRHWQISEIPEQIELRPNTELAILQNFHAQESFDVEPGDLLYLPPGLPHFGVATEESMTLSIGMRAPAEAEMIADLGQWISNQLPDYKRYTDPDLKACEDNYHIDDQALNQIREKLNRLCNLNDKQLAQWFGQMITGYRQTHAMVSNDMLADINHIHHRFEEGRTLYRSPWSRFAWRNKQLFVSGRMYETTSDAAQWICHHDEIDAQNIENISPQDLRLLALLIQDGHYAWGDGE